MDFASSGMRRPTVKQWINGLSRVVLILIKGRWGIYIFSLKLREPPYQYELLSRIEWLFHSSPGDGQVQVRGIPQMRKKRYFPKH